MSLRPVAVGVSYHRPSPEGGRVQLYTGYGGHRTRDAHRTRHSTHFGLPDRDAVADGSRPFHVYCDACIDGFGAALEQEQPGGSVQPDGSVRPIAYISRAPLDPESHWIQLDLETGSIFWAIKRFKLPFGHEFSDIFIELQGAQEYRQGRGSQRVRPAANRVHHRVRLHTPAPKGQR